jgi:hypothetical protein
MNLNFSPYKLPKKGRTISGGPSISGFTVFFPLTINVPGRPEIHALQNCSPGEQRKSN